MNIFSKLLLILSFVFASEAMTVFDSVNFAQNNKALKILYISPDGSDVPVGRQIVIQFNRPVVPIGNMERKSEDIPIEITPKLVCQWRWLNTSALSCNLDEQNELKAATIYKIIVNPGIQTEDGEVMKDAFHHQFITKRPDVDYVSLKKWLSASKPSFRIAFNQPVMQQSVESSLHIILAESEGEKEKVYLLKAEPDPEDKSKEPREGARNIWIVTPQEELPIDSTMSLKVMPGVVSAIGEEKGIANREILRFQTFPEFKFLGIKCSSNKDEVLLFEAGKAYPGLCDPMARVSLVFNSPVLPSNIKDNLVFDPIINFTSSKENDPWREDSYHYRYYGHYSDYNLALYKKSDTYEIRIPGVKKAATEYRINNKISVGNHFRRSWAWIKSALRKNPSDGSDYLIKDEFGRELVNQIDISFKTDHRKPNFEIVHQDAILEQGIDSDVPLYINNLKEIAFNYRKLTVDGMKSGLVAAQTIPEVEDKQFAIPFNVREMLGGKSGVVYGFLKTKPEVDKYLEEHRLLAQVTPYQLHVKLGHFNSVVWVTDMASGQPIPDAKVTIYKGTISELNDKRAVLSEAITSTDGVAVLAGTEKLNPDLSLYNSWRDEHEILFVRVDKGGELAILPINYEFLINSYRAVGERVYPANEARYGHIKTWGITAQGIYRVGDTVQYKFYVRDQDNKAFKAPPRGTYYLEIIDSKGQKVHEVKDITLDEFGSYFGEFNVSKQGAVGWYQFQLTSDFSNKRWFPLRVLVSDFTPSPFKVSNQINGVVFQAEEEMEIYSQAKLHSGGGYTDANIRVTAMLQDKPFISKNPMAKGFTFGGYKEYEDQKQIFQQIDRINEKGENKIVVKIPKQNISFGKLLIESAVQDDRGKYITAQSYADYVGVNRFVGLRMSDWSLTAGKEAIADYLVVNEIGEPVAGTKVDIIIEREETHAAKVKGPGNAYLTEFTKQWVKSSSCSGYSKADSASICKFTPQLPGYYRLVAKINDAKGREYTTEIRTYVEGKDYVLWNTSNDYSLEIIPEKASYRIGEKARYLLKNPYPGAKALITIERYGVIDSFVQTLDGSTPIVEFEIKPDYVPGFYLSVVVFSPRVDNYIEGQIDLGKPTFRIGYVTVPVEEPYKEIVVSANVDKDEYRPRETATLSLHAEPRANDKSEREPIEFAVAVLDESILDLIVGGKDYFDPYKGFYKLEGLDLRNYSLLTRLIGRQKFEKKGANPGGDGGSDIAIRDLFKFVTYWNPSIKTDEKGNAQVQFEVPDNLTGWRVLAMAVTPSDKMGLGDVSFKVNRPTEIRPVMPNQVTEGDIFDAGFSLLNRTDKKRDISVKIRANGALEGDGESAVFIQNVVLEPYKRATVRMPIKTKAISANRNLEYGEIKFLVTAEDSIDNDGIEHVLTVNKRRSLETAANYGTTTENQVSDSIVIPNKIHTDVGNISVVLSPSIISNIEGAFKYLRDYPYVCWEQKLTKGVMAVSYLGLQSYMPKDFKWLEAVRLPGEVLEEAANFQAPNGGMAYFKPQDEYVDPYLSAYTALSFNWLKKNGYLIPVNVEKKLHDYLDNFLRQDSYPSFYDEGMASTVRAVSLAALAGNNKVKMSDLDRYSSHVGRMSLFGKVFFVQAALSVDGADQYALEVSKLILSHANQSGGKLLFNEQLNDNYDRILSTPLRENCAILSTFLELGKREGADSLIGDIPLKLVRTITQMRGSKDRWENTQENMFCMMGLVEYAKLYETIRPNMLASVSIDGDKRGEVKFSDVRDSSFTFKKDIEPGDPGKSMKAVIDRIGDGRIYYSTSVNFASLDEHSDYTNAGIEVRREYSVKRNGKWELLQSSSEINVSELVKVDIFLSLPTARNFVVVEDPIPGGLEPINRDLATSSAVDLVDEEAQDAASWRFKYSNWLSYRFSRWSFYHKELRHDSARFYSDYLAAGNYHLSYITQAISPGTFVAKPIHAEEMYNPDIFGKGIFEQIKVSE